MSKNIKGKLIQDGIPTPDDPCEIKTILCNDIEIPVEFLKQNFVTVDGKKYIELQQENKHLKDLQKNMDKQYEELEERVNKATKFYTHELFKREQLAVPQNMPWESVEMFNILEGNK